MNPTNQRMQQRSWDASWRAGAERGSCWQHAHDLHRRWHHARDLHPWCGAQPLNLCILTPPQTKATPPIPALRLLLLVSVLALALLVVLDALSLAAAPLRCWCRQVQQRRRQQGRHQQQLGAQPGQPKGKPCDIEAGPQGDDVGALELSEAAASSSDSCGSSATHPPATGDGQRYQEPEPEPEGQAGAALAKPDVPLQRGLSRRVQRFESRHPRWALGARLPDCQLCSCLPNCPPARPPAHPPARPPAACTPACQLFAFWHCSHACSRSCLPESRLAQHPPGMSLPC